MLPIIAAAVSFITFGLFEEKSKTKSTNNSGSSAKQTPKKTIGRKAKVVSINATDNKYRASKSGTRTSSKYASVQIRGGGMYHRRNANQYGKAKGGKTYTENRPNRSDSKMYLEKGGGIRSKKQYNKEVDAYKYFVVNGNKVEAGFEFKNDALDMATDFEPKAKVMTKIQLKKNGITNPSEDWKYKI